MQNFIKYRSVTDVYADQVIQDYFQSDKKDKLRSLALFNILTQNFGPIPTELPSYFKEYFEKTSVLPGWADLKKIQIAERVFATYGPQILMILCCKSLPMAYTCGNGAEVLVYTGRLVEENGSTQKVFRRLMETTQFVVSVLKEGGLSQGGEGIRAAQKVRLMHSSIRHFILESNQWKEEWGKPINQQDMAGTLQSFSSLILEGLAFSGITLDEEEKDSYIHLWKVAGHILGVLPELSPDTYEDAYALGLSIFQDQRRKSEAGKILAKSLLDFMEYMVPGNLLDGVPLYFLQKYLGKENCEILELPWEEKEILGEILEKVITGFDQTLSENDHFQKLAAHFSSKLILGMDNFYYKGKKAKFEIPPSLKGNWGV
ncbi:oxygenase MpaB family protein [Leptospira kirschneri]|uniref:oxygenase MpaB family protein n=1 Tax=Leptospira kirschneri TaxID=29507 RepID=UPI000289D21B|nr:oxygenase MpaB family protein [Leptospira kirschneri]EMK18736.1 PF09995 family protein [Leptospira kirschneri serovar Bim str. PUO 1247]EMN03621.1 PF09995 family protein [Leptospira kirschneri serovar Bim str. 1051]EPG49434.1 PF09995 family protein [Leptospira kirschneri serovar Cynopteri str. 3522 CT]